MLASSSCSWVSCAFVVYLPSVWLSLFLLSVVLCLCPLPFFPSSWKSCVFLEVSTCSPRFCPIISVGWMPCRMSSIAILASVWMSSLAWCLNVVQVSWKMESVLLHLASIPLIFSDLTSCQQELLRDVPWSWFAISSSGDSLPTLAFDFWSKSQFQFVYSILLKRNDILSFILHSLFKISQYYEKCHYSLVCSMIVTQEVSIYRVSSGLSSWAILYQSSWQNHLWKWCHK